MSEVFQIGLLIVNFYALHEQTYKNNICDISRNKSKKEISVLGLMVPVG